MRTLIELFLSVPANFKALPTRRTYDHPKAVKSACPYRQVAMNAYWLRQQSVYYRNPWQSIVRRKAREQMNRPPAFDKVTLNLATTEVAGFLVRRATAS